MKAILRQSNLAKKASPLGGRLGRARRLPSDFALFGFQLFHKRDEALMQFSREDLLSFGVELNLHFLKVDMLQGEGSLHESAALMKADFKGNLHPLRPILEARADLLNIRFSDLRLDLWSILFNPQLSAWVGHREVKTSDSLLHEELQNSQLIKGGVFTGALFQDGMLLAPGEVVHHMLIGDMSRAEDLLFLQVNGKAVPCALVSGMSFTFLGVLQIEEVLNPGAPSLSGARRAIPKLIGGGCGAELLGLISLLFIVPSEDCWFSRPVAFPVLGLDVPKGRFFNRVEARHGVHHSSPRNQNLAHLSPNLTYGPQIKPKTSHLATKRKRSTTELSALGKFGEFTKSSPKPALSSRLKGLQVTESLPCQGRRFNSFFPPRHVAPCTSAFARPGHSCGAAASFLNLN